MPAELEKENAAPSASVGADAGQQFLNKYDNNIPDAGAESNENKETAAYARPGVSANCDDDRAVRHGLREPPARD